MRYFATEKNGVPNTLYRFEVSESRIVEDVWTPSGWVESTVPSEFLVEGQHELWELTYETARQFFPI